MKLNTFKIAFHTIIMPRNVFKIYSYFLKVSRLLTGIHGGIHNNEYGGTLEFFQWRKSYRLYMPTLYLFTGEY